MVSLTEGQVVSRDRRHPTEQCFLPPPLRAPEAPEARLDLKSLQLALSLCLTLLLVGFVCKTISRGIMGAF